MWSRFLSLYWLAVLQRVPSYELIEWAAAEMIGESADAFLGTQGYAWDTQSDMLMALIGAIVAQVLLGKMQDRQLDQRRLGGA
ncbi:MAG: hypothetical protein A2100_03595 [Sideroxydans sp. GWF2_59_14]|nr:MAG: hypothetical protein A2100_03595 [Sideroxydans sp. GWF2_59_14]